MVEAKRSGGSGRIVRIAHSAAHRDRLRSVQAAICARFAKRACQDVLHVVLGGAFGDDQLRRDLPVAEAICDQGRDLLLSWAERVVGNGETLQPPHPGGHRQRSGERYRRDGNGLAASGSPDASTASASRQSASTRRPGVPASWHMPLAWRRSCRPAVQSPSALAHAPRVSSTGPRQVVAPPPPTTYRPR